MHECRVVLSLLFEHAFWMWEVAGLRLLDKLSIAPVCSCLFTYTHGTC